MQTTSALYQQLLADPAHIIEVQAVVAGVTYNDQQDIISCEITRTLFSQVTPGIGNCCSAELDFTFMPSQPVPRMAKIQIFVRVVVGEQVSEWIPQGTFYTDTRSTGILGEVSIHAYDAMLMANQPFFTEGDIGQWPQTMSAIVQKIATAMGVTIDSRTVLNSSYTMEFPGTDQNMRTVLGYIGAANGGNWIITPAGELRLIGLADVPAETNLLVTENGDAILFGEVRLIVG